MGEVLQNPFSETAETEAGDLELLARVRAGSREALEALITRHQAWIYNLALRMVYHPQDAEDVTQEVIVKVLTKLGAFEQRSSFRTWLYRITVNHILNMKRRRLEEFEWTFEKYGGGLSHSPDFDLPDQKSVPVDVQLLVQEARIGCSSGMLLCLDREQRLVYIIGEVFGVTDVVGGELLEISRDNFRQKLSRARRDLHHFMHNQCGLINSANPCRCAKKTQVFMQAGYIDPSNLLFARDHIARVREVAPHVEEAIEELDAAYADLHRDHPFHRSPDFVASVRELMNQPTFRSLLGRLVLVLAFLASACAQAPAPVDPATIIALERGALDRWGKGDPQGYIEIYAPEITYFDPNQEKRIDGLDAMKTMLAPIAGKVAFSRFDMIDPKVQVHGDVALLTFNLVSYRKMPDGGEQTAARWNSTETYGRVDGQWRIIHSHWSYIKPELKQPVTEESPQRPTSS